jgi:hypothetical protein
LQFGDSFIFAAKLKNNCLQIISNECLGIIVNLKIVNLNSGTSLKLKGAVAQSVEQRTENPCVGGSIPPRTTNFL